MVKFADKIADRLGDHPVGNHLRGKKSGQLIGSLLLALGVLALVAVWAAATEGYEATSMFSPNWNLTDNDHWFSKFIPGRTGQLCQPAFINQGSSFYTTNGVFLWQMGKGFNVSSDAAHELAKGLDKDSKEVNFNGTKQYADQTLDHCDLSGLSIDMDLMQSTVTVQIYATCFDPDWPALLRSVNTYSINQAVQLDDDMWYSDVILPEAKVSTSLTDPINDLAADLWRRQRAIYIRTSNTMPIIRGVRVRNNNNCALQTSDRGACFEAPLSLTTVDPGFFLFPNLTLNDSSVEANDWNTTTMNFVEAVFAAARYDFASNMTNNIYVNTDARREAIHANEPNLDNSTEIMNSLDGAQAFLDLPAFEAPDIARIRTSYMCKVSRIKPPATFAVAVMGLALALFTAVFAAVVWGVKKVTGKSFGLSKTQTVIAPVAVGQMPGSGAAGVGSEKGAGTPFAGTPFANSRAASFMNLSSGASGILSQTPMKGFGSSDGTVTPSPSATLWKSPFGSVSNMASHIPGGDKVRSAMPSMPSFNAEQLTSKIPGMDKVPGMDKIPGSDKVASMMPTLVPVISAEGEHVVGGSAAVAGIPGHGKMVPISAEKLTAQLERDMPDLDIDMDNMTVLPTTYLRMSPEKMKNGKISKSALASAGAAAAAAAAAGGGAAYTANKHSEKDAEAAGISEKAALAQQPSISDMSSRGGPVTTGVSAPSTETASVESQQPGASSFIQPPAAASRAMPTGDRVGPRAPFAAQAQNFAAQAPAQAPVAPNVVNPVQNATMPATQLPADVTAAAQPTAPAAPESHSIAAPALAGVAAGAAGAAAIGAFAHHHSQGDAPAAEPATAQPTAQPMTQAPLTPTRSRRGSPPPIVTSGSAPAQDATPSSPTSAGPPAMSNIPITPSSPTTAGPPTGFASFPTRSAPTAAGAPAAATPTPSSTTVAGPPRSLADATTATPSTQAPPVPFAAGTQSTPTAAGPPVTSALAQAPAPTPLAQAPSPSGPVSETLATPTSDNRRSSVPAGLAGLAAGAAAGAGTMAASSSPEPQAEAAWQQFASSQESLPGQAVSTDETPLVGRQAVPSPIPSVSVVTAPVPSVQRIDKQAMLTPSSPVQVEAAQSAQSVPIQSVMAGDADARMPDYPAVPEPAAAAAAAAPASGFSFQQLAAQAQQLPASAQQYAGELATSAQESAKDAASKLPGSAQLGNLGNIKSPF